MEYFQLNLECHKDTSNKKILLFTLRKTTTTKDFIIKWKVQITQMMASEREIWKIITPRESGTQ